MSDSEAPDSTAQDPNAHSPPTDQTSSVPVEDDIPDNPLGELAVEKPDFHPTEVERATEHFQSIEKLIKAANDRLIPLAQANGITEFKGRAWLMRLDWTESKERAGFYDSPADIWPEDRRPDPTQLCGAAEILWHWLEQAGYEPFMERSHCQVLACEDHECKPVSGDFRGYFFYIGINWTVRLTAPA